MHWIDWTIVAGLAAFLIATLVICQRQVKSTADFMVGGRCAGRYLLAITGGIAQVGAISIIAEFEQCFVSGFAAEWWKFLYGPVIVVMTVTGWVGYRLRETRCMTLAQFFEVRYSRRFRVFCGILGWLSGVLNYGIFPAVSVKFFIHFCRLPTVFRLPGLPFEFSTYVCLLMLAIGLGAVFAISGGQIAIMLTDFIQGMFCNVVFLVLMVYLVCRFSWGDVFATLADLHANNPGQSLVDPFDTSKIGDFNLWFFLIGIAMSFLTAGTWQGGSGYNGSAINAHENKMSSFLGTWRDMVKKALIIFIPICAIVFFNNPRYAEAAAAVNGQLESLEGMDVSQARIPLFLAHILPVGLMGLFTALMFAAMLSTDDTYMHSWGTIFVQDVILPFRKKPFSPRGHLLALRLSILFVAVFSFFFSYLFKQTEYILLFMQITGAVFMGGAGAVLIGGLYSRSGTTLGAWLAMVIGSSLAVGSIVVQQVWAPWLAPWLQSRLAGTAIAEYVAAHADRFPLNGQILSFAIVLGGYAIYFIASYLDRKIHHLPKVDFDRMLHRGAYDTLGEHRKSGWTPGTFFKLLGLTDEFSRADRVIFFVTLGWTAACLALFVAFTCGHFLFHLSVFSWLEMWRVYVMLMFAIGVGVTVWLCIGGIRDICLLFRALRQGKRNYEDDGRVVNGRNSGEA